MHNENVLQQPIVKIKNIALINFSVVFVALSVALPWFAHQFRLAGPTYLPMHFFILFAGLLLGWRSGLLVGLFTPIISYAVSNMPPLIILPQITLEVATYGLIAGIFREKLKTNLFVSLFSALIIGRIGLLIGIMLFNQSIGSPIGAITQSIKTGWPGLIIQVALLPLIAYASKKYWDKKNAQSET